MKQTIGCIGMVLVIFARSTQTAECIYLENTDSGDISVVDIPGHTVVSTIKLGLYLDDVTASKDGRILYANRVNSLGLADPLGSGFGSATGDYDLYFQEGLTVPEPGTLGLLAAGFASLGLIRWRRKRPD